MFSDKGADGDLPLWRRGPGGRIDGLDINGTLVRKWLRKEEGAGRRECRTRRTGSYSGGDHLGTEPETKVCRLPSLVVLPGVLRPGFLPYDVLLRGDRGPLTSGNASGDRAPPSRRRVRRRTPVDPVLSPPAPTGRANYSDYNSLSTLLSALFLHLTPPTVTYDDCESSPFYCSSPGA